MSVKLVTGKKKKSYPSIRAASEATGIPYLTLWKRVYELKWPIAKAVNEPVRKYEKRIFEAA